MPLISCVDLTLGYGRAAVASGLSFDVCSGDYLCVIGENGSGKTTLMRAMLGLSAPVSGRVEFGDGLTARDIGYLPQVAPARADFPASVREVVRSGCLGRRGARPTFGKADKLLAESAMERLGVAPLARRCFRELSGGQQRRALLARAICAARRLLLLDEPAAGLDPKMTIELYDAIDELHRGGVAVVSVSHDVTAASRRAARVLYMGGGGARFIGDREAFLASEAGRAYSGMGGR